jgi:hypothetical protein
MESRYDQQDIQDIEKMEKRAVCKIYTTVEGSVFIIEPVNQGTAMFGKTLVDLMKRPNPKGDKVDTTLRNVKNTALIEANLIVFGSRKHFRDETGGIEFDRSNPMEYPTVPLSPEHNYVTPAISHHDLYKYVVCDNHPSIGLLVQEYTKCQANSNDIQLELRGFIVSVESWVSSNRKQMPSIVWEGRKQAAPDVRQPRPKRVTEAIKKLQKDMASSQCLKDLVQRDTGEGVEEFSSEQIGILEADRTPRAAPELDEAIPTPREAFTPPGGSAVSSFAGLDGPAGSSSDSRGGASRRRRPSRKYKKSKRVLRRKSRSTRRR